MAPSQKPAMPSKAPAQIPAKQNQNTIAQTNKYAYLAAKRYKKTTYPHQEHQIPPETMPATMHPAIFG
jgi:hypothetical protein